MAGEGGAIFNTALGAAGSMVVGGAKGHQGRKFARENRDYATRLANTAYQRQVVDLKAAGLNPMIAAMGGGGASSPMGAQPDMGGPMGLESSSARKVNAEIGLLNQNKATSGTQEALNTAQSAAARAQANAAMASEGLLSQQRKNAALLEPELQNKADAQSGMAGRVAPYLNMFIPAVASAVGAAALGKIGGKAAKRKHDDVVPHGRKTPPGTNVTGKPRRTPPKGKR